MSYTTSQYEEYQADPWLWQATGEARAQARRVDRAHRISWETGFIEGALIVLLAWGVFECLRGWFS